MKKETKIKIYKILLIVVVMILLALAIFLPLKLTGAFEKINNAEDLKEIILSGGVFSYLIFFVIQFLQTVILPIPAAVTTIAGTLVFGPWITFLISYLSIIIASIFCFFLGRKLGGKALTWIVGEKTSNTWRHKLERGKYIFFLMMLFPLFPDDILCIIVGATTAMTYRFFITTNLITRPLAIGLTCFLGSGSIIPFSGWGIPVWIALVIIGAVLFYLCFKFQPQIENFIYKLSNKISRKSKSQNEEETT